MACNSFVDNYFLQNYKIRKYFLQNLLRKVFYTKYFAKKLIAISCKFFFTKKFVGISWKIFKTKLAGNMNSFSSVNIEGISCSSYLNQATTLKQVRHAIWCSHYGT